MAAKWQDIPSMEPAKKRMKGAQEYKAKLKLELGAGEISLQFLPIVALSIIFRYLKHSSLLNLSLTSKHMRGIIQHELEYELKLWTCLNLKSWMTESELKTLRIALKGKAQHVKLIIVLDGEKLMSGVVFNFILNFHDISALRIESRISIPFILKYFTVFEGSEFLKCLNCKRVFGKQIQKVEFVKLNISVQRMTNSVEYSNIVK